MLKEKIKNKKSGILLYGMTPPKANNSGEELKTIALKHIQRIKNLEIDGLILYDIQDESDRTKEERPFPFIQTLDPCIYAKNFLDSALNFPVIIYRAVGKYDKDGFTKWLQDRIGREFYTVFVGAASKKTNVTIGLKEAYKIKKEIGGDITLGGIMIPERHMAKKDEHLRVFSKIDSGCEYFISQAVYNVNAAKEFLRDYARYAKDNNKTIVPIIFTLTPCGSTKTLDFMKWLGIHIPAQLEEKLKNSQDILDESVKTSISTFKELYLYGKQRGIPIGCNVESVSIRKVEIEASVILLREVKKIIDETSLDAQNK